MKRLSLRPACALPAVMLAAMHAAGLSGAVAAAEWSVEPVVSARQEYNTNYNLTPSPHDPTWITTITPTLRLSRKLETLETSVVANVTSTSFSNNEGQNSVNPRVGMDAVYRRERDTLRATAAYQRDTTLTNEALSNGVVLARATRETISVNPSWQRNLGERMSLILDYNLRETNYTDAVAAGLTNYRTEAASITLQRNVDARTQISATLSKSTFRTSPETTRSDTWSVRGGVDYSLSKKAKGTLSLGLSSTDTTNTQNALQCTTALILCQLGLAPFQSLTVANSSHSNTWLLNANFSNALSETTTLTMRANRDVYPSGAGSLTQTDTLGAGYSSRLTERLDAQVNGSLIRSQLPQSTSQFASIEPRVSYKLDRAFTVDLGGRLLFVNYPGTDISTNSKSVYLILRYEWLPIIVSH